MKFKKNALKNILLLLGCFVIVSSNAQVIVTTLTPQIKGSGGLSLDDSGNLIIADFGDFLSVTDPDGLPNDVYIMDANNNISTYSTGFVGASGNDFDSNGVLFQSDIRNSSIYKIIGGVRTFVTNTGIVAPVGLVFDSNDDFYVCNCGNNTIQKVTSNGNITSLFASGPLFSCPNGITVDEDDNLYVSNFNNGNVIKITPAGTLAVIANTPPGSTGGASNGHLDYHQPTRTLFIASHGSNKIFALRIDDPFNLIEIAGSGARGNADGTGATASFSRPNGVAVTPDGDSIYINSAVPVTNVPNGPLNPQLIRLITGVQSILGANNLTAEKPKVVVYPNPTDDILHINASLTELSDNLSFEIRRIDGVLVYKKKVIRPNDLHINIEVDISKLLAGLYIYTINSSDTIFFQGKVIIK